LPEADDEEDFMAPATGLKSLKEKEKKIDDLLRSLREFDKDEEEAR
jgi:hypothetical protein